MNISDLIQPHHLQRRAVIYVRQSSPSQVLNHQESTRLQYALQTRAIERGWHERDVVVIDRDLGLTGSTAADRKSAGLGPAPRLYRFCKDGSGRQSGRQF